MIAAWIISILIGFGWLKLFVGAEMKKQKDANKPFYANNEPKPKNTIKTNLAPEINVISKRRYEF